MRPFSRFLLLLCAARRRQAPSARRCDLERALRRHHGRAAPRDRERRGRRRRRSHRRRRHRAPRSTAATRAKQRLDRPDAILAPGLINTHTHAAMSLFRGIADDMNLQDWLKKFIFPAEAKNVDREFVRWGTRLACSKWRSPAPPPTPTCTISRTPWPKSTKQAGLRGVLGETVIGFPAAGLQDSASLARPRPSKFLKQYANDPLIVPAVAPHAHLHRFPTKRWKAARTLANRYQKPLVIHLAETKTENDELARQAQEDTDGRARIAGRLKRLDRGRARRVADRRRHGDSEAPRHRPGAQSIEQHEARQRRRAGRSRS